MLALSNRLTVYSVWIAQAICDVKHAAVCHRMYNMLVCELADVSVACIATMSMMKPNRMAESTYSIMWLMEKLNPWCCGTGTSLILFVRELASSQIVLSASSLVRESCICKLACPRKVQLVAVTDSECSIHTSNQASSVTDGWQMCNCVWQSEKLLKQSRNDVGPCSRLTDAVRQGKLELSHADIVLYARTACLNSICSGPFEPVKLIQEQNNNNENSSWVFSPTSSLSSSPTTATWGNKWNAE